MTTKQAVEAWLLRVMLLGGTALGLTDDNLPTLARTAIPLGAALVLAAMTVAEHLTRQNADRVSVAAAEVAQAAKAANAPVPASGIVVSGRSLDAALSSVTAALDASRAGLVATAPAPAPTVPAPAVHVDDYPTEAIGVLPSLPPTLTGGFTR